MNLWHVLSIVGLCFIGMVIVFIALAERAPIVEDELAPEAPHIPDALIPQVGLQDRIEARRKASPEELAGLRRGYRKMQDREKVEKLIREVGGC